MSDRLAPTPPSSSASAEVFLRRPRTGPASLGLHELWDFRELLYFLTWRDIKVRYRQTVLGGAWAVLQPLLSMVVFSIFFGRLARMPSDGIPYPLFSYAALVPWTLFANGISQSATSLVGSANLIRKVYFPRLVVPISSVFSCLVDFVVAFALLLVIMPFYHRTPTIRVLLVLPLLLLVVATTLGVGFWLAALNVRFRDVRYVVPFLTQLWLFASPVVYPSSLLSEPWRTLYGLNPMATVVEGFRWALLGSPSAPGSMALVSCGVALALFLSGAYYFRSMERTFADIA